MKLGTFIAILGEHGHLRDNLCTAAPAEEGLHEHQDDGGEGGGEATASNPASWPE